MYVIYEIPVNGPRVEPIRNEFVIRIHLEDVDTNEAKHVDIQDRTLRGKDAPERLRL